jgi:hypothetical protein
MTLSLHATMESLHSKTYLEERWLHSPLPAGFLNEVGEFIPTCETVRRHTTARPKGAESKKNGADALNLNLCLVQ